MWFGSSGGAALLEDEAWTTYNVDNSDLPSNDVRSIVVDNINKTTWFGTMTGSHSGGIGVLYGGEVHTVSENGGWIDPFHWQGSDNITSLIPRGEYIIEASNAKGLDGMEILTDSRFGFTVDYAGEITDQTPPELPFALAGGIVGDPSGIDALWSANDVDSSITDFRFALGSAPGATDIINWTITNETSVQLSGLGLITGQQYWLAVQARNAGGLWSASAYSGFVAGQPLSRIFLPVVLRP